VLRRLRAAVGFLTIVPVGCPLAVDGRELGRSLVWFPIVGLALGGALVGVYQVVTLRLPPLVAAVAVVATLAWLTGALHLDGLADCCDALAGARTRQGRLRLMRDPHVGAAAVVGVTCLLMAKVAVLASLPAAVAWRAVLLMPCLGRTAMVALAAALPYARPEGGTAEPFVAHGSGRALAVALGVALAAAWCLARSVGLWVVGGVALTVAVQRAACRRLLGGVTGDALGASGELTELMTVVLVGWLW